MPNVEWIGLLRKAQSRIPAERLWVNPDCGLKNEAGLKHAALANMVEAAKYLRQSV